MSEPTREGWWEYIDDSGGRQEVEVYPHPLGWLAVWCEDYGLTNYEPILTEEPGHVPADRTGLRWTGRWRPLDEDSPPSPASSDDPAG